MMVNLYLTLIILGGNKPMRSYFKSVLLVLVVFFMIITLAYANDAKVDSGTRTYPDVWDKYIPDGANGRNYRYYKTENDYLFSYFYRAEHNNENEVHYMKIFSFFTDTPPVEIELGKLVKTYHRTLLLDTLELADGVVASSSNMDSREPKRCPQALNNYMLLEYPDGAEIRKSILVLLDKPRIARVQPRCVDSDESEYTEKVVSVMGRFAQLDDGSFIIIPNDGGIFLRLDSKLKTRSPLLGKKIFIVDTDKVEDFTRMVRKHGYQYAQDKLVDYLKGEK